MTEWQINTREDRTKLAEALALRVPAAPRAFLRQMCKKQRVAINGKVASTDQQVWLGETVTVKDSKRFQELLELSRIQPALILYEDRECIVINKPAGLAIHKSQGHDDNLLTRLIDFFRLRGETFQVSPIHRLDVGTSGAVLFGKGRSSISELGQAITAGLFTKRYQALVSGPVTRQEELVSAIPAKGKTKEARTLLHPITGNSKHTLLELELETGRQHQIRYQLASSEKPIVGDRRYRGENLSGLDRPFLHCHYLSFPHPVSRQKIEIKCPLPSDLSQAVQSLDLPEAPG